MNSELGYKASTNIVVRLLHKDPLLRMGVLATIRADRRFDVHVERPWPDVAVSDGGALPASSDVVVADYETGLAIAAEGRKSRQMPRIMVVSQRDKEAEILHAMDQGVLGYVLIGCTLDEIVEGVLLIHQGQRYLGHQASRRVAETYMSQALTARELDVLRFLVVGWSNKLIANELDIAVGTVKSHVKAILDKLDASSRTEAAAVASRRGMIAHEAVSQTRPTNGRLTSKQDTARNWR